MRAKIGSQLFRQLKPTESPYEIADERLKGFLLRVQPTGVMTYYVSYRLKDGRRNRFKLGSTQVLTPTQARDMAKKILTEVAKGTDPNQNSSIHRNFTIEEFLDREYWPIILKKRRRGAEDLKRIKRLLHAFLNKRLTDLSTWFITKLRSERVNSGLKTTTVNKEMALLRAALTKCVEWGLLDSNPMAGLKPFRTDTSGVIRYLTTDEETRLHDALKRREERMRSARDIRNERCQERDNQCLPDMRSVSFSDHLKPMIVVSLNTGIRRGELFSLKWTDIDFDRRVLTVRGESSKSGKTRHIPMNKTVHSTLAAWRKQNVGNELLFVSPRTGGRFDNTKKAWTELLAQALITNFRWHDMRHHFASKLVMAGTDLNTVRELLGHGDIKMTLRYAHLAPEHMAAAVALLDAEEKLPPPSE